MGHQNILTLVDYFETMNNCMSGDAKPSQLPETDLFLSILSIPRYGPCPRR